MSGTKKAGTVVRDRTGQEPESSRLRLKVARNGMKRQVLHYIKVRTLAVETAFGA